jgi:phage baseplate assembly protein W
MALENPRTTTVRLRDKDPDSKIGITLPIQRGQNGFFQQSSTLLEQTKSNLKNLLLTVKGERLAQPEFGSNIYNILFENMDTGFSKKIEDSIREAVAKWLPHVILNAVIIDASHNTNTVNISVQYSLVNDASALESLSLNLIRAGD